MNNKWMNELKHLADGAEKTPPQGLLDDIKREMSRRGLSVSPAAKRIVNVPWWQRSRVAAAVAVLLAGIATVGLMTLGDRGRAVEQQAQIRRGTGIRLGSPNPWQAILPQTLPAFDSTSSAEDRTPSIRR